MGWIGDQWGRKRALEISIALMLLPSFLIGCLPSYRTVGRILWLLSFTALIKYFCCVCPLV
jgi:MHS family proline/betaine transporter-like MFS transporter